MGYLCRAISTTGSMCHVSAGSNSRSPHRTALKCEQELLRRFDTLETKMTALKADSRNGEGLGGTARLLLLLLQGK